MEVMKLTMDFFIHTKDVNHNDIIRASAILDMFQDIAGIHADKLKVGYEDLKEKNYAWVVLYQKFEIMALPPYLDFISLTTWPKPKQKLEFEREYFIKDKSGKELVKGISNWVVMDLNTRGLVRSRDIAFDGTYESFTNFEEKCKRRLNLDETKIQNHLTYEVELEDIDHNGHMNNSRYLHIIEDRFHTFESRVYIKTVEISYLKEAKYKDKIQIGYYSIDDKLAFIGYIQDERCFECIIGEEQI